MEEPTAPGPRDTVLDPSVVPDGARVSADTGSFAAPIVFGGRYEAIGVLGGGTMGTVYRTRDRALEDVVALKLLKRELAVSPVLVERFRREVKLARRVTHRNIARVFDIGAHDAQPFLTMELIEGPSLAEVIARRGSMTPHEIITIATELTQGLTAAHSADVVHRDLKPENVVVGTSRFVITDFGVACALTERDLPYGAGGAFVGSPAYMAPEQVEGLAEVDARADLYALGVILFELLTGRLPWEEGTVFAVAAARLMRPPPDPRDFERDVPDALAELTLECMARHREGRPSSADEVGKRLSAAAAAALPRPRASLAPPTLQTAQRRAPGKTIAIMPIMNAVGPELEYLCRGFVTELVHGLEVTTGLAVRHAPSARDLSSALARESARALGVHTVVSGSLRRVGETLRLAIQLMTVDDGVPLWAKRFEGGAALDLALAAEESVDEIATVLAAHRLTARTDTEAKAARDPRAHDLHMRGRYLYQRAWYETNERAVKMLEEAHALEPSDPSIAATLALALARGYGVAGAGDTTAARARRLAERALSEAPRLADAQVALAALHGYHAEGVAAATELRRALDASPDAVEALDWMGRLLAEVGETERGLAYLDRAISLEPTMIVTKLTATIVRALLGDWPKVAEDLAISPTESADKVLFHLWRSRVEIYRTFRADAGPALRQQEDDAAIGDPQGAIAVSTMSRIVSERHIDEDARLLLDHLLPTAGCAPRRAIYNAQVRAELLTYVGLYDAADEIVADADANGMFDLVWMDRCPALDPLRDTPSFGRARKNVASRAERVRRALIDPRS